MGSHASHNDPVITQGDSFTIPEALSPRRRNVLTAFAAASAVGGVGAAIPIACTMMPSERAKAAGAPISINIASLQPGQMIISEWRGKPIWVVHRNAEMLKAVEEAGKSGNFALVDVASQSSIQQENCKNIYRSIKKEFLVVIGICTHLGCSPKSRFAKDTEEGMPQGWPGGFYCPCHGSTFDLSGRVYTGVPAPTNLSVPPHYYISDTEIFIGADKAV